MLQVRIGESPDIFHQLYSPVFVLQSLNSTQMERGLHSHPYWGILVMSILTCKPLLLGL